MSLKKSPEDTQLIDTSAKILFSKRVEEVTLMDLSKLSDICDFYLIGTCQSEAQMKAVISGLSRGLKELTGRPLAIDYRHGDRWAVLDFGNLLVHLFEEEYRKQISIERLWADAEKSELNKEDYLDSESEQDEEEDEYL